MKPVKNILLSPILSEKSSDMRFSDNQYVFRVAKSANKVEIKKAVEIRFNVRVDGVSTLNFQGKIKKTRGVAGRTAAWKKAFVRVRKGEKISEFEGA
jgi:large subunit ribosomal protein L23